MRKRRDASDSNLAFPVGLPNFLTGSAGWSILVFNYGSPQTAVADSRIGGDAQSVEG
jgi:hypothetical protein